MIDWNKPIELEDGTPVTLKSRNSGFANVYVPLKHRNVFNLDFRSYDINTGKHSDYGVIGVRNKEMKMIDKNKPVTAGGVDAKIIHTFDCTGNLVVVIDGSTQVHNFRPDGYPVAEGGLILTNKVERREMFYNIYVHTGRTFGHNTFEAARRSLSSASSHQEVFTVKRIHEDGALVSTEIVS